MRIEDVREIFDHAGSHVDHASKYTILHGLNGLGNSSEDPEPVASKGELATLDIIHLETELPHKVVINECRCWCW